MQAAAALTAACRWLGTLADATQRPALAASSTVVSDCAYCAASLSSRYGPDRNTSALESSSELSPEFASQAPCSIPGLARFRPAASRHPIGDGPVYAGAAGFAAIVVTVALVDVVVRPLPCVFLFEGSVLLVPVDVLTGAFVVVTPVDGPACEVVALGTALPGVPVVRLVRLPGGVDLCVTPTGSVPVGAVTSAAAVWPDAVVAGPAVEALFAWLAPPHADRPIAAEHPIASRALILPKRAPRVPQLVSSSETCITTRRIAEAPLGPGSGSPTVPDSPSAVNLDGPGSQDEHDRVIAPLRQPPSLRDFFGVTSFNPVGQRSRSNVNDS